MYPGDDDAQWRQFHETTVAPFWHEQVESRQMQCEDDICVQWYLYTPAKARGLILISPGRLEAALKYQELLWQLAQQGYAVAIIDHRGQGRSDRLSTHSHHGHVHHFDDFVKDFAQFAKAAAEACPGLPQYLLAHSMGGAIGALYLARYPHNIQRAVLSAPMFGIYTPGRPHWLVSLIARTGTMLNRLLQPSRPWYFWSMSDYREVPFAENQLTQSPSRYQLFRDQYAKYPELQLGGPTYNWVNQALNATRRALREAPKITIPVLLLQGGADTVVSQAAQHTIMKRLPHPESRLLRIEGARHELFIETDRYRQPALQALLEWFQKG
ncbi:alpha/beta fold hydrolase [Pseudidiomarina sp.]|uniref:alpha/beta fold hydrolase n=1 Tax=Pseudidiomarina sp. TaxID=2081707 RepID=UPI00299D5A8B|nr:alpha/beta fold hydrolase [Pseudidiomarina sp.]MDX1706003.1 alpha/beta fold hydrolase [Pseudidiomarina sp.]